MGAGGWRLSAVTGDAFITSEEISLSWVYLPTPCPTPGGVSCADCSLDSVAVASSCLLNSALALWCFNFQDFKKLGQ